jgi:acyl-[acyl-carrier-protein] desaturase
MQPDGMARSLEPEVERLLARHQATATEWFPHELVPWGRARDFVSREEWWDPDDRDESAARSALFVNLLTEDNLPYYFRTLSDFGRDGVWGEWTRRWTAEEGRHAIVIRDYLMVTRAIDPVSLERGRMQQVTTGVTPQPSCLADALCYTTLQELATRIAHRNTGNLLEDPAGRAIMARVSADENLHFLFYRDLASAAIELDPSTMVVAMDRTVREFTMPGTGIPDYAAHARRIAAAGVYDYTIFLERVLQPVLLQQWRLPELEGLDAEAEAARDRLVRHLERLEKVAARLRRALADEQCPSERPARVGEVSRAG